MAAIESFIMNSLGLIFGGNPILVLAYMMFVVFGFVYAFGFGRAITIPLVVIASTTFVSTQLITPDPLQFILLILTGVGIGYIIYTIARG